MMQCAICQGTGKVAAADFVQDSTVITRVRWVLGQCPGCLGTGSFPLPPMTAGGVMWFGFPTHSSKPVEEGKRTHLWWRKPGE